MGIIHIGPSPQLLPVKLGPGDILEIDSDLTGVLTVIAHGDPHNRVHIRPANPDTFLNLESLVLTNPRHVTLSDLNIMTTDDHDGVLVWATEASADIRLERVFVKGARNGIAIGTDQPAGLRDVIVDSCLIQDCLLQGILCFGPETPQYGLHNVKVTQCRVEGTRGDPTLTNNHSGSGIILGSVDEGEIVDCHAEGNGAACVATEGPEGIFVYDCRRVRIRNCASKSNRTGGPADGGGFGIDIRCVDCLIENCDAIDNDGAGILVWNLPGMIGGGHVLRGNRLSNNCRRTTWHGEITVTPSAGKVEISENTIESKANISGILTGIGAKNIKLKANAFLKSSALEIEECHMPQH